jgi:hypothetical protein
VAIARGFFKARWLDGPAEEELDDLLGLLLASSEEGTPWLCWFLRVGVLMFDQPLHGLRQVVRTWVDTAHPRWTVRKSSVRHQS